MGYALKGDSLNLEKLLATNSLNQDIVQGVAIIGADGRLKKTNISYHSDENPDFSNRPYFLFHEQNNVDSFLVGKPVVSKLTGKMVIVMSSRLNDAKGRFAGVVALQVEPATFTSFYAQAHLLPQDFISLIAPDGITYARRTGNLESSGENIIKSPLFIHIADHADSFYFAKDAIRGIPSWISYRKLQHYPIIATVGSSLNDILIDYAKHQPRYLIPRIVITLLLVIFSVLFSTILIHRKKLSDHLVKEEERNQQILTEGMIAGQEREREWIGRELHDNVNQVLTTVKLYLDTASAQCDNPLIPRSMQLINNTIGEIRNLSHKMSTPTLGTGSLVDSINALIEMIGFSSQLEFEFDHERYHPGLAMNQKLALYRILQEQLNNVVKHAEATKVSISLQQEDDKVILRVVDNGKGFERHMRGRGIGINNMISRAKVFRGTVHIASAPRKGCCLTAILPFTLEKSSAPASVLVGK